MKSTSSSSRGLFFIRRIILLMALMSISALLLTGITFVISNQYGISINDLISGTTAENTMEQRNLLRFLLFINQFLIFLVPALAYIFIIRPKQTLTNYLYLDKAPSVLLIGKLFFWFLISLPSISFSYIINKKIPLPASLMQMEDQTAKVISQLLENVGLGEMLLNFLLMAVLAPLAEEIVFRGILQKELNNYIRSPQWSIWIVAIVFSAIHFQFEGFIPRMLLGAMLGYTYFWSGTLWVPILCHAFVNGGQLIAQFLVGVEVEKYEMNESLGQYFWVYGLVFVLVSIAFAWQIHKENIYIKANN